MLQRLMQRHHADETLQAVATACSPFSRSTGITTVFF